MIDVDGSEIQVIDALFSQCGSVSIVGIDY